MTDVESLVLSGEFFNGRSGSSSPRRTPSPDAGWHDDEQLSDGDDSDAARSKALDIVLKSSQHESIGMGPGRTGVKGVIRDRDEANSIDRSKHAREIDQLNKRMEKASLGGKTFLEEEREKDWEKQVLEGNETGWRSIEENFGVGRDKRRPLASAKASYGVRFGHLREVGMNGFLPAIEQEAPGVWVVVHLFEPSLDRCYYLDEKLARLARLHPDTKFLRVRASALGFTSSVPSSSTRPPVTRSRASNNIRSQYVDEDDPYDDGVDSQEEIVLSSEDDEEEKEEGTGDVDTDMLPTMLVYRDGDLVHNWVRVDWEAGRASLEELLVKHHIIAGPLFRGYSADEDDLLWSDEEKI